jgi:cupin 2 domain-containing protein
MHERVLRGHLESPSTAPTEGERTHALYARPGLAIEQILSGRLPSPVAYEQDGDEWVVVLDGQAKMLVSGRAITLEAGDWLLLPAGVPHTLLETAPGTNWLAVHLGGAD